MSIAVMNWVWANSPTSGNERLVLLALADACSRDDGTGCWPSAATIARKANISDRTVRRVIARLEAGGHVIVHRGGGRAGVTNSYTVATGIHSPGQNVTPDNLSGGDTGDRSPLTQPCQGTPDRAVSPRSTREPPGNRRRARARGAARRRGGWRRPDQRVLRRPRGCLAADRGPAGPACTCRGGRARHGLDATEAGVGHRGEHFGRAEPVRGAGHPAVTRRAAGPAARSVRPPWCGECDQVTRMLDYHGDAPRPCPRCKAQRPAASVSQRTASHPFEDCAPPSTTGRQSS
jgi:Helix-turn-helix domain